MPCADSWRTNSTLMPKSMGSAVIPMTGSLTLYLSGLLGSRVLVQHDGTLAPL